MLSASAAGSVVPIRASAGGFTISGLLKTGGKIQQELEEEGSASSAAGEGEGSGAGSSSSGGGGESVGGTVTGTADTDSASAASIEKSADAAVEAAEAAEGSGEPSTATSAATAAAAADSGGETETAPASKTAAEEGGNPPEEAGERSGSGEQAEEGEEGKEGESEEAPPPCGKGPCVTIANSLGNYVISGTLHETLSPQDAERIEMYEEQTGRDIVDMFNILPNITAVGERLAESKDRLSIEKDALADQVRNLTPRHLMARAVLLGIRLAHCSRELHVLMTRCDPTKKIQSEMQPWCRLVRASV